MLPFVNVTWLPFCLTARKPKWLQRILMRSFPSIGLSLFKSRYGFYGLLSQGRQVELQSLFEVRLGLLHRFSNAVHSKRGASDGVRAVLLLDDSRLDVSELD